MQTAAMNDEQTVLIIEDYQLLYETFLQSIDSILSSGSLPNAFTTQELDNFSASLREQASQDAYQGDLLAYLASSIFFYQINRLILKKV